jgi:hypothetical protein
MTSAWGFFSFPQRARNLERQPRLLTISAEDVDVVVFAATAGSDVRGATAAPLRSHFLRLRMVLFRRVLCFLSWCSW